MIREVTIFGKLLKLNVLDEADKSVFYEIFQAREYACLDDIIKTAKFPLLDVGAHKGYFSIYLAALNPLVNIFAFEPDAENFSYLKENLKLNNLKNVTVKNVALGSEIAERKFFRSDDSHNHSLFLVDDVTKSDNFVKMNVTTLEKIFNSNRFEKISLLKLDCEGAEFEILENLPQDLFAKIENIYIEYHQYSSEFDPLKLQNILLKNSFKVNSQRSKYDARFGFISARKS